MAALAALICFILSLFDVRLGDVDLTVLGFCFVALHLLYDFRPWGGWNRNP
jgi:hypothetical protein